jgi:hypothetical protein
MIRISAARTVVGTSAEQRERIAERVDCHPTWRGDAIRRREVDLDFFADSGLEGDQFSGDEVAGQPVAGRVDSCDGQVVGRPGTGGPVTRQSRTAAAGRKRRSATTQRSS